MPPGTRAFFVSDLHGRLARYEALLAAVEAERPAVVFVGGDLLPPGSGRFGGAGEFLLGWLGPRLRALREALGAAYPRWPVILGNDDPRTEQAALEELAAEGLVEPVHGRCVQIAGVPVYGYGCIPPSPFLLKDWERYDVSRFVDPGCVSPEEGTRSVSADEDDVRWGTIAADLERLAGESELSRAVFVFHAPPYRSALDRAALDGRRVDHAPLDPHVGSIAIRRLIESRQPLLTLHGHVHESARLTGSWRDRLGRTVCLSAAHDGPELALVSFELEQPDGATRRLL